MRNTNYIFLKSSILSSIFTQLKIFFCNLVLSVIMLVAKSILESSHLKDFKFFIILDDFSMSLIDSLIFLLTISSIFKLFSTEFTNSIDACRYGLLKYTFLINTFDNPKTS